MTRKIIAELQAAGYPMHMAPIDPRDPDYRREGIFQDHNCWRCQSGNLPCPFKGRERDCESLRARND